MVTTPPPQTLHLQLLELNRLRLCPQQVQDGAQALQQLEGESRLRRLEIAFVESERACVRTAARDTPADVAGFIGWFTDLLQRGEGQADPLFAWLEDSADLPAMRWFLAQELAGEAGFDDLVALTQLRLPDGPKMELARNYWDEMGRGHLAGMHGPMLHRLVTHLDLTADAPDTLWEALAVGNTMGALAANRLYTYQSLGALGVVELTAPGRCEHVNRGLRRLDVEPQARQYYAVHATLDVKHAEAWVAHVLEPLVRDNASLRVPLAEGALMRLRAGARSYAAYRRELWAAKVAHAAG